LYWIGRASAFSGLGIFQFAFAAMVGLCVPLFSLSQKKLCANAAGFFTTIVSPTRAQVTRDTNMQHGWSITTSAGLRFVSAG
jgi:hypothetical protein